MARFRARSNRPIASLVRTGLLLGAVLLSFGVPSAAAVLPATGTYSVQLATAPPVVLTGSGSASSVGGPGSAHTVPAGFFSVGPTAISVVILPTFTGIDHFTVPVGVSNTAGSFGPNGAMPLLGTIGLTAGGILAGKIPLGPVGGAGSSSIMIGGLFGTLVGATFQGAGGPTPLAVTFSGTILAIPITVTATAFDNRSAGGAGVVQLVAPATGSFGVFGALPVFGVLQIAYTPEPGTWLLLGAGLAALGAGVRRTRSSK